MPLRLPNPRVSGAVGERQQGRPDKREILHAHAIGMAGRTSQGSAIRISSEAPQPMEAISGGQNALHPNSGRSAGQTTDARGTQISKMTAPTYGKPMTYVRKVGITNRHTEARVVK